MKKLIFIVSCSLFFSCRSNVTVYYNDTRKYDGGEIWGSQLHLFFKESDDIFIDKIASKKVHKGLNKIKRNILLSGDTIPAVRIFENYEAIKTDGHFYDYAFILNKNDTLYANMSSNMWRYGNRTLTRESSIENLLKEKGIPPQKTQH